MFKQFFKHFQFFILFLGLGFVSGINAGPYFFALDLNKSLKVDLANIQTYVKNRIPGDLRFDPTSFNNLHITLKEIGSLSFPELQNVNGIIANMAKQYHAFTLKSAIKRSRLHISDNGLVTLKLEDDNRLTNLARKIESNLHNSRKQNKIGRFNPRMDFPGNGHIALGYISSKNKAARLNVHQPRIRALKNNFRNQINDEYRVKGFVLLKSNSPQLPRIYDRCKTFALSVTNVSPTITYQGGGVLPYAVNNGKVYFLFSQEASGPNKGDYSDFGGKADRQDLNHGTWIAAREFTEESCNLFGQYTSVQPYLTKKYVNNFRIEAPYVMFVVQVPFEQDIDKTFKRRLSRATNRHQREKSRLQWVSGEDLERSLLNGNRHITLGNGNTITLRRCAFSLLKNEGLKIIQKLNRVNHFAQQPMLHIHR